MRGSASYDVGVHPLINKGLEAPSRRCYLSTISNNSKQSRTHDEFRDDGHAYTQPRQHGGLGEV